MSSKYNKKTKKRIYGKGKEEKLKKTYKSSSKSFKPIRPRLTKSPTIRNFKMLTGSQDDFKIYNPKPKNSGIVLKKSNSDPTMSQKLERDSSSDEELKKIEENKMETDGMMEIDEMMEKMGMDTGKKSPSPKGGKKRRRRRRRTLKKKRTKRKSRKYRKRVNPMDIAD